MGKIRIKALGDETAEKKQKKESRLGREAKQAKKRNEEKEETKNAAVTPEPQAVVEPQPIETEETPKKAAKTGKKVKVTTKRKRSKKYYSALEMVEKNKMYNLSSALSLLPKIQIASFDETVELHINTLETGIAASITLPHGTGKKLRIAVADDKLIAQIEKGLIDFDILLAAPQMMGKLAKVARVLGPKGLMPNPKNGTITDKPEDAIKKYEGGHTSFKTEAKAPIIHLSVGKLSFGEKKLSENITTVIAAVKKERIKQVVLKSTMSPGIKIDVTTLS